MPTIDSPLPFNPEPWWMQPSIVQPLITVTPSYTPIHWLPKYSIPAFNLERNIVEKFVANVSAKTAINPAVIQMILAFIAQMVAGCTKPPTPAQLIAGHGAVGAVMLNRAIREGANIPAWSADGRKIHEAMVSEAAATPESDVAEFVATCCQ